MTCYCNNNHLHLHVSINSIFGVCTTCVSSSWTVRGRETLPPLEERGQAGAGEPLGRRLDEGKTPSEEQNPPHERGSAGTSWCRGANRTVAGRGPAAYAAAPSPSDGAAPRLLLIRLLGLTEAYQPFHRARGGAGGEEPPATEGLSWPAVADEPAHLEAHMVDRGARLETHGTREQRELGGGGAVGGEGCAGGAAMQRWRRLVY
jgi:hypothetical protein